MALYRISGFMLANARKMCKFFFGDFYIRLDLNERDRTFEIRLHKTLKSVKGEIYSVEEHFDIPGFQKYWGAQWVIIYIVGEEAATLSRKKWYEDDDN